MAWGQAVAFQGTITVVYPETDEPAYRAVFETVIQGIRNRLGPSQIQTYALAAGTKAPAAFKAWLAKQTTARAVITLGRGAYEDYQASGITLPAVSGLLDLSPQLNPTANGISLSADPALFFETLKRVLPGTRRVHVVYNPAKDQGCRSDTDQYAEPNSRGYWALYGTCSRLLTQKDHCSPNLSGKVAIHACN